ncbi:hypothetical protein SAICODRAFT_32328 [Saitoella complicata NRRL Y-17804]|uniref:uncharacterized protein n=1 Tax=Saitoella complicata (strain BCRC 22490 / CBS 7301 / JCM 7358 / NBRC 10748 / NRRL Y-17804) TaxID=698492 RepID=UPI0008675DEE|nr:uncharacterized protein SAICODRAFT_32328 [Saitoella complicata NRRL Y-17804]ODQ49687.1 hypothetical protein SAICODRAFT_32328 [Saitoella complicata NRRL Y-17804]
MKSTDAVKVYEQLLDLPKGEALQHGHCNASLSLPLLDLILSHIEDHEARNIVSIGSGTGLLERLLEAHSQRKEKVEVYGIEVSKDVNLYLDQERMLYTNTDLAVSHVGRDIVCPIHQIGGRTWLWIYPRRVQLLEAYLKIYSADDPEWGEEGSPRTIVIVGPRSEFGVFEASELLQHWARGGERKVLGGVEAGLREWEVVGVWKRVP